METNILFTHKDLVEKGKSGDRSSQYQLYELYVDAMYNVSMRMLRTKEDAEDVVQDSFVEAFKNLSSFRYESTFGSWLKRIVINKSINHLKLKRVPITAIDDHEFHLNDETVEEKETDYDIKKIKKVIEQLPLGYKQIINLYLIEGYDHVEISDIMNITVSTSKSQYHRAKKKLIEMIKEL
ncbi:RNA polymerase sigma-70 factor (ECF subfamily) [Saonia flava]|uniref:RNA polymerase sigma factor n=1 Tax=Saonia flava TaxID=523696 RepID=A0A846QRH6_9FLAO|nr:RNA polymerase sigma factor [Saonia flava]NJB69797.1 RNA polymerase sigma-70 factor (ECF subfamily) [Saonia flava]